MNEVLNACRDALNTLIDRGYDREKVALYLHPEVVIDTRGHADEIVFGGDLTDVLDAMVVEGSKNVPKNMVAAIHLEAARHGPDAVAFSVIDDVE